MTESAHFAALLESRAVLAVTGPDARTFLQGLVTNDMNRASPEQALYAALLTPQGKFLFDFFVLEQDGGFRLDCAAERAAELKKRLTMYKLRADVAVSEEEGSGVAAFVGAAPPGAPEDAEPGRAWPLPEGIAFADPRLAGLGFRVIAPRPALERLIAEAGAERRDETGYDRHRLALGVPAGGLDIEPDRSFLLESNLDELNGVDFRKGCYVGQELTARTKHRGTIRKRLMPVNVSGPLPEPGTPVTAGKATVGEMRSGRGGRALALIRLDRYEAARESGETLRAGEAEVTPDPPPWLAPALGFGRGEPAAGG
ncbi:MAG: YgfZ/GcvT domain-containing protein [Alphaproteobacteria bacterium]